MAYYCFDNKNIFLGLFALLPFLCAFFSIPSIKRFRKKRKKSFFERKKENAEKIISLYDKPND